jgi:hypothetical protein
MVRLRRSIWVVLGAAVGMAVSCSGSSTQKTTPYVANDGGANDAGASPSGAGADASPGGDTGQPGSGGASGAGGANAGGDGALGMTDGWLSGTRLRAVLDVAGSAKLFKTWHDTLLDIDCAFAIDANNVERCLPIPDAYAVYADDKCTKPIVILNPGASTPPYVPEPWQPFTCGHGISYFTVGADTTATTGFSNQTGTCAMNGEIAATQIVKRLGTAVPETTFVAATKTVQEPRDDRLSANVRYAEDGSRQVTSHFDLERQAVCNPRQHQGDGYACIPEDRAYVEVFFSDKACKVPAAYHPAYAQQVCGHEPAIIQNSSPDFTDGYFEIGKQVAGTIYSSDGPNCDPFVSPGDPDATYFSVGKEVPWSQFPPLSSKNEGGGRIAINVLRGSGDELVSREEFFDTMLETACGVGQTADSKMRCIPRAPWNISQFADSKCTAGLFVVSAGDPLPMGLDFLAANAPTGGVVIYRIGAKTSVPAKAWSLNGLDCQEAAVFDTNDYYATTALAPTELAPVTREVE